MTAYNVVRNRISGFVSFVAKERVAGNVRTTGYICGLGNMTHEEFIVFKNWAHSLKPQEYRKERVKASSRAISEKAGIPQRIKETKESIRQAKGVQSKIKRKLSPKTKTEKRTVRKNYPVRRLAGYKGLDRDKTHTQIMREREGEYKIIRTKQKREEERLRMSKSDIKKLQAERVKQRKEYRHWDLIISEGGLESHKKEKGERAKATGKIKEIDNLLRGLE